MSPEQFRYKLDEVLEAESLLIGRVVYESFAEPSPKRSGEFADKMNAMSNAVSARVESFGAFEPRLRALEGQRDPAQGSMSGMDQPIDHPCAARFGQRGEGA